MTVMAITGTPGAGKTTVLEEALKKLSKKVEVVNYADKMLEAGKDLSLGEDHDALRKLSLKDQRELQKKAAEKISGIQGTIVVDTHCTVKTDNGYLPGLPEWVVKTMNPVTIILIEADPEEIVGRRQGDKTRKRDEEAVSKIKFQQDLNRIVGMSCAVLCGATLKIITNHDNKLDEAAEELAKVLEEV